METKRKRSLHADINLIYVEHACTTERIANEELITRTFYNCIKDMSI